MKKLLSLALAAALALTLATGAVAAGSLPFTDIPQDYPYREAVEFVYREGIMNGMTPTLFDPERVLSRAMMVTVLYRMAGSPPVSNPDSANRFDDVDPGSWYGPGVYWARANGFSDGYGAIFSPEDNITRQQLVVILHRFVGKPSASLDSSAFSDAGDIASWAADGVAWAVEQGIITPSGGKLYPQGEVTRALAAEILMRFINSSVVG